MTLSHCGVDTSGYNTLITVKTIALCCVTPYILFMGTCIAEEPGLCIFRDTYPKYGSRWFLCMDENLTAEVNSVTFHNTALIVATAVKTSDLTIHLNIMHSSFIYIYIYIYRVIEKDGLFQSHPLPSTCT